VAHDELVLAVAVDVHDALELQAPLEDEHRQRRPVGVPGTPAHVLRARRGPARAYARTLRVARVVHADHLEQERRAPGRHVHGPRWNGLLWRQPRRRPREAHPPRAPAAGQARRDGLQEIRAKRDAVRLGPVGEQRLDLVHLPLVLETQMLAARVRRRCGHLRGRDGSLRGGRFRGGRHRCRSARGGSHGRPRREDRGRRRRDRRRARGRGTSGNGDGDRERCGLLHGPCLAPTPSAPSPAAPARGPC
jgi:hypothetical protein